MVVVVRNSFFEFVKFGLIVLIVVKLFKGLRSRIWV